DVGGTACNFSIDSSRGRAKSTRSRAVILPEPRKASTRSASLWSVFGRDCPSRPALLPVRRVRKATAPDIYVVPALDGRGCLGSHNHHMFETEPGNLPGDSLVWTCDPFPSFWGHRPTNLAACGRVSGVLPSLR